MVLKIHFGKTWYPPSFKRHVFKIYLDFYAEDILETIKTSKKAEDVSRGWRNVAQELGLTSKNISMAHVFTTESIETDSSWEFCHPLYGVLREWTNRFTTTPKYKHLVQAMKSLGFKETAGKFFIINRVFTVGLQN